MLYDPKFVESVHVQILDLGNAVFVRDLPRPSPTPPCVCAPEIMFDHVAHLQTLHRPLRVTSGCLHALCMYELLSGASLFYRARPTDALLGAMATKCGEIPSSWRAYWDSRQKLRSLC
ncbi:hypothetical protein B0H14DRAFT_551206 [Mycena olivaceomarginata]|nr:hypothetical protein B0H14DRAFT_551206 [Mycena olivaceomarginata]